MNWVAPSEKDTVAVTPRFFHSYKPHLKIHCFRRTRDLLLQRLLSGQINLGEI
jgi:hypothetical protein